MTINLFFIRHGYSIANENRSKTPIIMWPFMMFNWLLRNARLHSKGIDESSNMEDACLSLKVDHVFCSPSARCIETAHFMFVKHSICSRILVAPYLRERFSIATENQVFPYALVKDPLPKVLESIEYADTEMIVHTKHGNLNEFVKWAIKSGKILDGQNIAVVTHSVTLMSLFRMTNIPNNNSIWHASYDGKLKKTNDPVNIGYKHI